LAKLPSMIDKKIHAKFEAKAKIIKAMAHPTRLFIVDQLSRKEWCVCELKDMIGADMSTVSKHLSILKSAGIVQDEKRGTMVFYSLKMPCILNFFGCVESVIKSTAKLQMELIK
jgi:DNA-binding transcriptional ArsR family regulator